jgi:hypothetical protein
MNMKIDMKMDRDMDKSTQLTESQIMKGTWRWRHGNRKGDG